MADVPVTNWDDLTPDQKTRITPEELKARGGLYASGYWGDTPDWRRIDDATYAEVAPKGTAAINEAYFGKIKSSWINDPSLIDDPWLRFAVSNGRITAAEAADLYIKDWGNNGDMRVAINKRVASNRDSELIRQRDAMVAQMKAAGYSQELIDAQVKASFPELAGYTNSSVNGSTSLSGGAAVPSTVTLADGSVVPTTGLTASQANAIENLSRVFQNYGLGTLSGAILNMVKQGYSADTVSLMLQDTPEYKQRFAANEARRKAGMAVLAPVDYLAAEAAYRKVMGAAGLPKGFYDQQEDFTDFISKDISPAELQARVQNAADAVINADPYYTQALRDMYGMTNGDMIAFVLSPDRSLPLIQQKANAVSFGAAAARQGVQGVDNATAEMYGGMGVEKAQAEQGFAQIATQLPRSEQLGDIYGIDYGVNDAVSETFGNNVKAQQKRRRLVQAETDSFGGQSGVRGGTLGQATQGLI